MADEQINTQVVLTADTKGFSQQMLAARGSADQTRGSVDKLIDSLDRLAKMAGRGLTIISAGTVATMTGAGVAAARFDSQLSSLKANAAITDRSMQGMVNQVNRLRQDLPLTTENVIALVESLQKMGVNPADMEGMVRTFTKLSAATGENLGALATGMIQLQQQMGTLPTSTEKFSNTVAGLSANMGVSATATLGFANSIAPVARTVGITQQEVLGFSSAFAKAGQDGYAASNVMTQLIQNISRASRYGTRDLEMYANVAGMTSEEFQKLGSSDQIVRIFNQINAAGPDAVKILDRMGFEGARAQRALTGVVGTGQLNTAMQQAGIPTNAMNEGAAAAMTGLEESTQRLRNSMAALGTEVGGPLVGAMTSFVDVGTKVTQVVTGMLGPISGLVNLVGAIAAPVTGILGGMLGNVGMLTGAALAYSIIKGPMTAGLMAARGRGPEDRVWGRSISSFQSDRGGPIQRGLYRGGLALGGDVRGALGPTTWARAQALARERFPEGSQERQRINEARRIISEQREAARKVVADLKEESRTARARVSASAADVRRAGIGPRTAQLASLLGGATLGFTQAALYPFTAGSDITRRAFFQRDRGARREGFDRLMQNWAQQPGWSRPGSWGSVFTGQMPAGPDGDRQTLTYRDALRNTTRSLRNFSGELLKAGGGITAIAARGVGRAGMSAVTAAGGGIRGAGGALMGAMGGLPGMAIMGGLMLTSYSSSVTARNREEKERIEANTLLTNSYNDYASALGLATRAIQDFTGAVTGSTANLPGEQASGRAVTTGLRERAQQPGYQLVNPALAGMTEEQAAAYMESTYSYGTTPEAITRAATTDLIRQFGAERAQGIIGQATAGGTNPASLYAGPAPRWDITRDWQANQDQRDTLNNLVLPAMASQMQQAAELYGAQSEETSSVFADQMTSLVEQIRTAEGRGEEDALIEALAVQMGAASTEELGLDFNSVASRLQGEIGLGHREAIVTSENSREATRQMLEAMDQESELWKRTMARIELVDNELYQAVNNPDIGPLEARGPYANGVSLARVTPEGFFTDPERRNIQRQLITEGNVGSQRVAGVLMGENELTYARFMAQEGNTQYRQAAAMGLIEDIGTARGTPGAATLTSGQGAVDAAELQGVIDDLRATLETTDPGSSLGMLTQAALEAAQALQGIASQRMNFFEQQGFTINRAISASRLDLNAPGNLEEFEAARAGFEEMQTNIEGMIRTAYKAIIDFEHQLEQQTAGRARQLAYQQEDFNRQRSRAQENFDRQRSRGEEDYARQQSYAQEDFDRQRALSLEDFNRQRARSDFNYQLSRRRAEEDFTHQQVLMARSATQSIQDMYARMTTQRTWDAQNLLVNMRDQARLMGEQQANLAILREQGLSGDVIEMMGLNQFSQQGQVARLVSDIATDPALIGQLNEAISGRVDLATMFVFDEDNPQWKESQRAFELSAARQAEDYARSTAQGSEDFERAMGLNEENFRRSMDRMDEMHGISMERQSEDFGRMMDQGATDFQLMMDRNETEWGISLENMRTNFNRQFEIVNTDFQTMSETVMSKLTGTAGEQYRALSSLLGIQWEDIMKLGGKIETEFPALLAGLVGGEKNYQNLVELGVFGKAAGSSGTVRVDPNATWGFSAPVVTGSRGTGAPEASKLDVSNQETYDRILNAQRHQGIIHNVGSAAGTSFSGDFAGGGTNPLAGSGYRITSRFGMRTNPVTGRYELHNGTDMAAATGTPIKAYADGIVSFAGVDRWSGNVVQIEHGGGMRTRYHHMSRLGTEVGSTVRAGELIGYVGSTGNSTGPHLHFSVFQNGKAVDSLPYIGGQQILGGAVQGTTAGGGINMMRLPTKAEMLRSIVAWQRIQDLESAFAWGPLSNAMPKGKMSLAVGSYWAGQYNPGFTDNSLRPENTDWYANGSIFNSPRRIGVGERGPEAVIPLSGRGADFMADVISKFAIAGADKIRTAGRATAMEVKHVTYYQTIDNGNHFHGKIEARAEDPNRLVSELERKARMSRLNRSHR